VMRSRALQGKSSDTILFNLIPVDRGVG